MNPAPSAFRADKSVSLAAARVVLPTYGSKPMARVCGMSITSFCAQPARAAAAAASKNILVFIVINS